MCVCVCVCMCVCVCACACASQSGTHFKRTAVSDQRKLQQLISGKELGDWKPTQLLRKMQQLLGDKMGATSDSSFLRELFFATVAC